MMKPLDDERTNLTFLYFASFVLTTYGVVLSNASWRADIIPPKNIATAPETTGTNTFPAVIVIGFAKGIHWYVNQPTPTDQLYALTQQRSVSANFPDTEKFLEASIERILDAVRDDLPSYHVYLTMAHITEAIYKVENLNRCAMDIARSSAPDAPFPSRSRAGHANDGAMHRVQGTKSGLPLVLPDE